MEAQLKQEIEILHNQVCSALGDPKRLMILYVLSRQPQCVNDIAAELDIPHADRLPASQSCANARWSTPPAMGRRCFIPWPTCA
jgi:hypothetical protein